MITPRAPKPPLVGRLLRGFSKSRGAGGNIRNDRKEAPGDQCSFGWPSLLHSSYYVASNEVTEDLTRRWARGPANLRPERGEGALFKIAFKHY